MFPPIQDLYRVAPEIVLCGFGMLVMLLAPVVSRTRHGVLAGVSLVGAALALASTYYPMTHPGLAYSGLFRADAFSLFVHWIVCGVAFLGILGSIGYLKRDDLDAAEYCALVLFATAGMGVMAGAHELLTAFIGLEISSIASYILASYRRDAPRSNEAAMKYFLLGSFATAFFLYGVALMFGATGSTHIDEISKALLGGPIPVLAFVAVAFMFVGLGFKVAVAPFHVWTPDVYEGAPAPIVGLMSTAPKAAAFAVLLRIIFVIHVPGMFWVVWIAAALSMTLGNLGALVQNNIKRLLAYSSIAHAGYLFMGFAAAPQAGTSAAMFYTASYAAMNLGALAVVSHFANSGERYVTMEDYEGLGRSSPLLAAMLTIFLLSLIGIPMTGGFFAKFYVFGAAIKAKLIWLTIIGVLNSGIGGYYYLRIIVMMYMRESRKPVPVSPIPFPLGVAITVCMAATLYLGILPGSVLQYTQTSAQQLIQQAHP